MNHYHISEAIGRGKFSTVYKGRKKKTIEYFAIKSVDKSQKSKVLQALLAAATAAASSSSRISSFRKDTRNESAHQEVVFPVPSKLSVISDCISSAGFLFWLCGIYSSRVAANVNSFYKIATMAMSWR
ncbi:Serine/threonine-protein kinase RUNKEL [Camellia lanceoleosa]|uniref:Serine/threonine-protein kinase RUNKEL n=1 Tax=Camellia lanceoleosa TaxID=1840588 RepID=A0ACC0H398_9ERIC|nr:Serine/threonine-protein kinase RUNKEL [Camellia lanceoleosa]